MNNGPRAEAPAEPSRQYEQARGPQRTRFRRMASQPIPFDVLNLEELQKSTEKQPAVGPARRVGHGTCARLGTYRPCGPPQTWFLRGASGSRLTRRCDVRRPHDCAQDWGLRDSSIEPRMTFAAARYTIAGHSNSRGRCAILSPPHP